MLRNCRDVVDVKTKENNKLERDEEQSMVVKERTGFIFSNEVAML